MLSFQLKQVWGGGILSWVSSYGHSNHLWFLVFVTYGIIASLSLLSRMTFTFFFRMIFMKVLSEYAEAKMTTEQQNASLGETYLELVKRLDEGILLIMSSCAKQMGLRLKEDY